jgi:hypothetical protein
MTRAAALAACVACASFMSCEAPKPSSPPPVAAAAHPDPDVAARVGGALVRKDQLARIASAQGIQPAAARDLAIHDALLAEEARARGLDAQRGVQLVESATLARVLAFDIAAAAEARGPVTDAELDAVTARHWVELDRPESSRTVHAIVLLKKDAPPDARTSASQLAETIRGAVAKVTDVASSSEPQRDPRSPEDPVVAAFRKAVTDVPKGDRDIRVEPLPPVAADGRVVSEAGGHFDEAFARAAAKLERRGDVSPVIESSFGYHVILLLERVPAHTVPREERRAMVREEVMSTRARVEKDRLLGRLRAGVSIQPDAAALLALVPVER